MQSPRGREVVVEHIAHRGARREAPENTLAAFQRAVERGADGVELDVHATRDGVVVVHHDAGFGPGAGSLAGRSIAELEWDEIARATATGPAPIPRLDQVLEILPSSTVAYVEIKGRAIEAAVAAVIQGSRARCAVHSFDHGSIRRMRELAPEIPRGILLERVPQDLEGVVEATLARDVWPAWRLIDQALVDRIHAAGARAIAWTVNQRRAAAALQRLGVDGICTDDVRLLDGL